MIKPSFIYNDAKLDFHRWELNKQYQNIYDVDMRRMNKFEKELTKQRYQINREEYDYPASDD